VTEKRGLHKMGPFLFRKERLERINLCRVQDNDITLLHTTALRTVYTSKHAY